MEPACQDHSCTLNTRKSIPKIAGSITVYLIAECNQDLVSVLKQKETLAKIVIAMYDRQTKIHFLNMLEA